MTAAIMENIEMKLFASFGSPSHLWLKDKNTELVLNQKLPEVSCKETKCEEALVKQRGKDAPAIMHLEGEGGPPVKDTDVSTEAIEIEMEILQPYKEDIIGVKSGDPSVLSPDPEKPLLTPRQCKANKHKWRRMEVKSTGLVVKDVICIPYEMHLKRDDLYCVPSYRERETLASMGLMARITIDSSWLSEEIVGRLTSLFKHRFIWSQAEKFKFAYLQCFQGSGVLYEPSIPSNCWNAQEVLRICENGCLYILSRHTLVDTVRAKYSDPLQAC